MKTNQLNQIEKSSIPHFDVERINAEFEKLTARLGLFGLPKFDADLSDNSKYDVKTIVRATITHRATNKWQRPDAATSHARRIKSIESWYHNEQRLSNLYQSGSIFTLHSAGLISREIGHKVLRYLRRPLNLIEFGPGESYHSRRGDTSVLAKLEPENHSVSYDNLDLWVSLIVTTRGLFRPYLQKWVRMNPKKVNRNRLLGGDWKRTIVLQVIESIPEYVVYGSRQAFVDKDNDEDRVIEVNPLGDVVLQKVVGNAFRKVLLEYGIDLDENQELHKNLISDKTLATIDASKASDTITPWHIKWLLPTELTKIILQLSQEYILATSEDGRSKVWTRQYKLCSMGSGFTFELLTLMFYSIGRIHTSFCYAYGDDLIVPRAHAQDVVESLESVGFIINRKKTFLKGPISESCGAFHVYGFGYITCYSLKFCSNPVEAVATVNKLRRILVDYTSAFGQDEFSDVLLNTHKTLLSHINPVYLGPVSKKTDIPTWVEDANYVYRKKRSSIMRQCFKSNIETLEKIASDFQTQINDYCLVLEFTLTNKVRLRPKSRVRYESLIFAYIHAGRRTKFEIKDRCPDTSIKLRCIDNDGFFVF